MGGKILPVMISIFAVFAYFVVFTAIFRFNLNLKISLEIFFYFIPCHIERA